MVLGKESTFLGWKSTFLGIKTTLFGRNLKKRTFFDFLVSGSSVALLSVVGRWNEARYKRGKRDGNLNKSTFLSFGVLWSFIGSSLVLLGLLHGVYI